MNQALSLAGLVAETQSLVRRHGTMLVVAALIVELVFFVWDRFSPGGYDIPFKLLIEAFGAYWLTLKLMEADPADNLNLKTFFKVFVTLVIITIASAVGLVLLVLPGIIVAARWMIAVPITVSEGRPIENALAESWERTRSASFDLYLVVAVLTALSIAVLVIDAYLIPYVYQLAVPMGTALEFIVDLLMIGTTILQWVVSIAAYRLLGPNQAEHSVGIS